MNDVICSRCGKTNPDNAAFCGSCGAPLAQQPPVVQPVPAAAYPAPPVGAKVMGDNTKWALGLAVASLFCCGPITGIIGVFLAKKDMDEIAAGRAPQLDEGWAKAAFYLNIGALVLFVIGLCFYWFFGAMFGLRRF